MLSTTNTTRATSNTTTDVIHKKNYHHTVSTKEQTMAAGRNRNNIATADKSSGMANTIPHKKEDTRTSPHGKGTNTASLASAGATITPPTTARNSNTTDN